MTEREKCIFFLVEICTFLLKRTVKKDYSISIIQQHSDKYSDVTDMHNGDLPFRTCTLTLATSAFDGLQEYFPESVTSACCMSR